MPRPLLLPFVAATLSCSGVTTTWTAPTLGEGDPPECLLTLCLPGAGGSDAGDNPTLAAWCDELPGVVRRCEGEACRALLLDVNEARAAIDDVAARLAGRNFISADGRKSTAADACTVQLVGYSWGGVDAASFAGELLQRKAAPRLVSLLVVLDGFTPFGERFIDVPAGIAETVSFRHSVSDPEDCSSSDPFGPYRGLPIRCAADAACTEFDLSREGLPLDHCDMVEFPGDAWFSLVSRWRRSTDLDPRFAVDVIRR